MRKDTGARKAVGMVLLIGAAVLMLFAACGRDNKVQNSEAQTVPPVAAQVASCPTTTSNVIMKNEAFIPSVITVPVNTVVKWTNEDPASNYWIIIGSFESPRVGPGQHICLEFTAPGTYEYHCDPLVRGTVIVQPAAATK